MRELLLLDVAGGLILSSNNPFDFHTEILFLLATFFEISKNWLKHYRFFRYHHLSSDFYHGNNLNQTVEVSQLYLALLSIPLLLLILHVFFLNWNILQN